ncbi:MAG: hypothetical protein WA628_05470 [Terriglobales bacterium]
MNAEIYAQWLRDRGYSVVRTASSYWHSDSFRVYQAFPYHWLIDPTEPELSELFFRHGALAARYSMQPTSPKGYPSYAVMFENRNFDLEHLGHRTRKNVRLGLRNCKVEPTSFQCLVNQGWDLQRDTLDRQGRSSIANYESWRKGYLLAANLPGFEVWGAFVNSHLAAYLVTFPMDDCIFMLDHKSHREFLHLNVNNALTYEVTQHATTKSGVRSLFYGLESLDAAEGVAEFKMHMGYQMKPIRQRVALRPQVEVCANKASYRALSALSQLLPGNRILAKAKGMLRLVLAERKSDELRGSGAEWQR